MSLLRSLLFALFQAITLPPYGIMLVLVAPFLPLHARYKLTIGWPRLTIWAARVILGIRWQWKGYHNLPKGPAVLLSKHQSAWETLAYVSWMPTELCFVFKRELLFVPFFGWGIALLKMIHINRRQGGKAMEQILRQGKQRLTEGRWVIFFPEGTRIAPGKQGKYRSGGTRLACAAGVPVVPIAVNSGDCWPRNAFVKTPGEITISIGKPIDSSGKTPDALMDEVERWIESEMRVLSPHQYPDQATALTAGQHPAAAQRERRAA